MKSNVRAARRSRLVLRTATLMACGLVASYASADDQRTETVKFQDLNVNKHAGVEALYGRIHSGAGASVLRLTSSSSFVHPHASRKPKLTR